MVKSCIPLQKPDVDHKAACIICPSRSKEPYQKSRGLWPISFPSCNYRTSVISGGLDWTLKIKMVIIFIILSFFMVWATFRIFNCWVVRKFIFSKPPGRKMITVDIFWNMIPVVICVGVSLRTICYTFPFFLSEATIVPFSFLLGVFNVAGVCYVIFIFHPRSVITCGGFQLFLTDG